MTIISLIIPVYKVEDYIERCIASVIDSKFSAYEVIIVYREVSNDNSVDKIKKLAQNNNKFVYIKQEGKGLSDARNVGLAHARGKYVFFIDSDDFISDTILGNLYQKAEIEAAEIVMFQSAVCDERNDTITLQDNDYVSAIDQLTRSVYSGEDLGDLFYNLKFYAWNALYLKSFLDELHYEFPVNLTMEDICWNFYHRQRAGRITAISEVGYFYTVRSQSLSHDLTIDANIFKIFDIIEKDNEAILAQNVTRNNMYAFFYVFICKYHIKNIITLAPIKNFNYATKLYALFNKISKIKKLSCNIRARDLFFEVLKGYIKWFSKYLPKWCVLTLSKGLFFKLKIGINRKLFDGLRKF